MNTVTVFRVEHRLGGYGPYLNGDDTHHEIQGLHSAHGWSDAHPGPYHSSEDIGHLLDGHSFGFPSRDMADTWFKGFKRKLKAADFVINVYEAPEDSTHISRSGKQAIFFKSESKRVDTQSVIRYRS